MVFIYIYAQRLFSNEIFNTYHQPRMSFAYRKKTPFPSFRNFSFPKNSMCKLFVNETFCSSLVIKYSIAHMNFHLGNFRILPIRIYGVAQYIDSRRFFFHSYAHIIHLFAYGRLKKWKFNAEMIVHWY